MSDTEGIVDRRAEFPKFTPVTPPPSYGAFVEAMRDLMDLAVASDADDAAYTLAAEQIRRASATLAPHREATEAAGPASRVPELPGRGNPMQIPWRMERFGDDGIRSIVPFRRAHLGGHSAAHGGMIAQLFDEHLGWIVYSGGTPSHAPPTSRSTTARSRRSTPTSSSTAGSRASTGARSASAPGSPSPTGRHWPTAKRSWWRSCRTTPDQPCQRGSAPAASASASDGAAVSFSDRIGGTSSGHAIASSTSNGSTPCSADGLYSDETW